MRQFASETWPKDGERWNDDLFTPAAKEEGENGTVDKIDQRNNDEKQPKCFNESENWIMKRINQRQLGTADLVGAGVHLFLNRVWFKHVLITFDYLWIILTWLMMMKWPLFSLCLQSTSMQFWPTTSFVEHFNTTWQTFSSSFFSAVFSASLLCPSSLLSSLSFLTAQPCSGFLLETRYRSKKQVQQVEMLKWSTERSTLSF